MPTTRTTIHDAGRETNRANAHTHVTRRGESQRRARQRTLATSPPRGHSDTTARPARVHGASLRSPRVHARNTHGRQLFAAFSGDTAPEERFLPARRAGNDESPRRNGPIGDGVAPLMPRRRISFRHLCATTDPQSGVVQDVNPKDRNVRSKRRCSCVLQFTRRRAFCCVLHRPTSQVIHRSGLCIIFAICIRHSVLVPWYDRPCDAGGGSKSPPGGDRTSRRPVPPVSNVKWTGGPVPNVLATRAATSSCARTQRTTVSPCQTWGIFPRAFVVGVCARTLVRAFPQVFGCVTPCGLLGHSVVVVLRRHRHVPARW